MTRQPTHAHSQKARARVRTPGKYVVFFLFAPVALTALGAGAWLEWSERRQVYEKLEYRTDSDGNQLAYAPLPEFLVDLSPDRTGRTAYLKMRAVIAFPASEGRDAVEKIETQQSELRERLTFFLRQLRPDDLAGTEGMARVKRELTRRVNLVLQDVEAADVIIEDLVIQ